MSKEAVYIGAELREKREEKKITLEQLANQTKINIRFLRYIEEGNLEFLPTIYTRSFVKIFAEMVGLDGEVYARRFDIYYKKKELETNIKPEVKPVKPKPGRLFESREKADEKAKELHLPGWIDRLRQSRLLWFSSGAAILLILFFILLSTKSNNSRSPDAQMTPVEIPIESAETPSHPSDEQPIPAPQPLKVILYAHDMVWVRVSVDNTPAIEATYYSGDQSEWTAKEKVTFRIGNTRAISLRINDRLIDKIDQSEKVVNLEVTREGIQKLNRMPDVLQPPVPGQTGLRGQAIPAGLDTGRTN